jgi:hypothetical protein
MTKSVVIEEFHVTLFAPGQLSKTQFRAIRRTLTGARFQANLRLAVGSVVRRYPSLKQVTPIISR